MRGRAEQPGSAATVLSMRRSGDRGAPAYNTSKHIFYAADRFAEGARILAMSPSRALAWARLTRHDGAVPADAARAMLDALVA